MPHVDGNARHWKDSQEIMISMPAHGSQGQEFIWGYFKNSTRSSGLSSGSKNWQQFCGIPHFWTKPCAFPWQVSPNAFNYSALISSCGRAGQWQLAWELYQELFGLGTCEGWSKNPIVLKANACKNCKSLSFNFTKLQFSTEGSWISECKFGGFLWVWVTPFSCSK